MKTAKPAPCRCTVYKFPHNPKSCARHHERTESVTDKQTLAEINAEMLALHDAAEARAINSGAW